MILPNSPTASGSEYWPQLEHVGLIA